MKTQEEIKNEITKLENLTETLEKESVENMYNNKIHTTTMEILALKWAAAKTQEEIKNEITKLEDYLKIIKSEKESDKYWSDADEYLYNVKTNAKITYISALKWVLE